MHFRGLLFISCFLVTLALDVEVAKDFKMDIEFRLGKVGTEWTKRGVVSFLEKGTNNYRSKIEIKNEIMSNELIESIKKECKLQGTYYIRFINSNNIFYSSINPCSLIENQYRDLIIINSLSPINEENLMSINYSINQEIDLDGKHSNNKFHSRGEVITINKSENPIFGEEIAKEKMKPGAEQQQQQSFFSKYWWIFMIVMFMLMMNKDPEEGQQGQQGQQQQTPQ